MPLLLSLPPDLPVQAQTWLTTSWTTAPACIDDASLGERSRALVGAQAQPRPTTVELSATPGPAWTIDVRLSDGTGIVVDRQLRGDDCETLTDAVALIVAVHVDAVGVVRTRPTLAEPPVVAPVRPDPPDPPIDDASTTASSATRTVVATPSGDERPAPPGRISRPRMSGSAAVAGELGLQPKGAAAVELALGLWWPHVRLEIGGLVAFGPAIALTESSPAADFTFAGGLARACGVPGRGSIEVPLCLALEIADFRARVSGPGVEEGTVERDSLWVGLTPSVRPTWAVGKYVALFGLVDVPIALRRHRYLVEGTQLHTIAPVGARFGLGVQVRVP